MKIINPYSGIDFNTIPHIVANSHEHIGGNISALKRCYDRGVRWFANLEYAPSVPLYPFSNFLYTYKGYNNTPDDYTLVDKQYGRSYVSFVDKNGNTIYTNTLPQIPNAEHPKFAIDKSASTIYFNNHFNVLGSLWAEAGHGADDTEKEKINTHPIWETSDIEPKFLSDLLYEGKVFGTINHCSSRPAALRLLNAAPNVFKGVELYNNGGTDANNAEYKEVYDFLLNNGYRLWVLSVVDWQGDIGVSGIKVDRGCNVLYIPNWDNMSVSEKTEAGLDAYISGSYYASGRGVRKITAINVDNGYVNFSVDGSPTLIKAVTNKRKVEISGNTAHIKINSGETYIRFEAYYDTTPDGWDNMTAEQQEIYVEQGVKDFIFTNPIWIEDNDNRVELDCLALGII